jgi:hypothetical protein
MAWTRTDGWVWVFACVDHYTAEAWAHVAKVGDRFAALQPVYDAVVDRWGRLDADIARGLQLRHDWGPQYRSAHFTGSLAWLGIADSPAFLGEPETNGCAERWIRTLKEQCLWAELHDTIDQLRQAVSGFVDRYNTLWLIQRHGHQTRRRPIRQRKQRQRHDQLGTTSVQETGRCSRAACREPLPRFSLVAGGGTVTADALHHLADVEEIRIGFPRPDGSTRSVPIWVVQVGDHLYVRSVRGPKGGWYRRLRANPDGEVRDGEHRHLVRAEPVSDAGTLAQVTDAYATKYAGCPRTPSDVVRRTASRVGLGRASCSAGSS